MKHQITKMKFQAPNAKSQINIKSQIPRLRQGFGGQANSKPFGIWQLGFWSLFVIWILLFGISKADAAVIQKPPANLGLVGYWSFNEGTSTYALDYSGNGNKGTLTGMALNPSTPSSGWNPGKLGRALSFDGTDDEVQVADNSLFDGGTALSVSFWMNQVNGIVTRAIVTKWTHLTQDSWFIQNPSGVDSIRFYVASSLTDSGSNHGATPTGLVTNGWHHVVAVFNGNGSNNAGRMQIYIDGASQTLTFTGTIPATLQDSTSPIRIGDTANIAGQNYNGLIDEVRIYNRALSAAEVAGLYQSGAVKFKTPDNKGLVGYWSFNEGTSTYALDYSGNGNKGTLTSMALNPSTPSSGWNPGKLGKALSFDGSDDYVDVGDSASLDIAGQMTVAAWINVRNLPAATNWDGVVAKGATGETAADNHNYVLTVENGGLGVGNAVTFLFEDSTGNNYQARYATTLSTQRWYHLVGVYDTGANTVRLYLDGVQQASTGSVTATPNTQAQPVVIGRNITSGSVFSFDGLIDEVRIYNRALSASEVAGLYKSGAVKFKTPDNKGLVGYWSFNEGTSTYALDYSGSGNKGTLTSMALNPSTPSSGWNPGKLGKALSFDGVDDEVDAGAGSSINVSGTIITISAWIYPRSFGGSSLGRIIDKFDGVNGYVLLVDNTNVANGFSFGKNDGAGGGSDFQDSGANTIVLNKWQHVAFTWNGGSTANFYVNGVLKKGNAALTGSINANPTVSAGIGGSPRNTTRQFNGLIDEVRIYNRALNADEVQKLYESGR